MLRFSFIAALSFPLSLVYAGDLNSQNDSLYSPDNRKNPRILFKTTARYQQRKACRLIL
ncbi:hypothetical protein DES35_101514 [Schleiferia thermophila]|uniref:Uncharacterized protein n=1 Tax=Schleiferia thermophila TaxID=884107 RepID=A0A369A7A1_9FLAO|nr:hypothetical protein DES35_101514 [Schleiferia thermophila]